MRDPEENEEIRFTLPRVDNCPYCHGRPNLERRDGLGFRFVCPVCADRLQPWNRTLSGAVLDWNAQEYRGSIVYRGRDA